jgi:hypothetical protein
LISDFAILRLAAILGRTPDSARHYVGCIVELAHRLPQLWAKVQEGRVPVWKALRVADPTRSLNPQAVAYVDRHLAPFAAGCSWAQIDRLIDEALTRDQPDEAEERRRRAADTRRFDIHLDSAGTEGTVAVDGTLDIADALDLEQAVADKARELAALGCDATRDVRRSMALGEIARDQLALDLATGEIRGGDEAVVSRLGRGRPHTSTTGTSGTGRGVELFVHLTDTTLTGGGDNLGRLQNLQVPVTAEQIREWCNTAGRVLVRPVLDLAGCEPVDCYEIPDRHRRLVQQRDHHCVAPYCHKRAEVCDVDHVCPYGIGGPTCPCNLASLCRGHHRAKTHDGWQYEVIVPGVYLWTLPTGHRYLVTPAGTRPLGGLGPIAPGLDTPSASASGYSTNDKRDSTNDTLPPDQ